MHFALAYSLINFFEIFLDFLHLQNVDDRWFLRRPLAAGGDILGHLGWWRLPLRTPLVNLVGDPDGDGVRVLVL